MARRKLPIRTKNDIIALITEIQPCSTKALQRAAEEGNVSILGRFQSKISDPYWIVEVRASYSQEFLKINTRLENPSWDVSHTGHVYCQEWVGDFNPLMPVDRGDFNHNFMNELRKRQWILKSPYS